MGTFKNILKNGFLGPGGMLIGHSLKSKKSNNSGGLTDRDPNFAGLLQNLEGGSSAEDTLTNILKNFQGNQTDLEEFMRRAGPFMFGAEARRLRNSDAMKYMDNQANWDQGAMGAYGAGAGAIAKQGRRATDMAQARLSASGLGRGSARAALQQQGLQNAAGQQAQLWSQTFQQAQQNRWNSAAGVLDAHRMLSQMALGQQITPRVPEENNSMAQAAAIGGGVGNLMMGLGALL